MSLNKEPLYFKVITNGDFDEIDIVVDYIKGQLLQQRQNRRAIIIGHIRTATMEGDYNLARELLTDLEANYIQSPSVTLVASPHE